MPRLADLSATLLARRGPVLAGLVVLQVALTLALAASVHHNGWLFYQGGDQIWYATGGWLLAHAQIPYALVGYGWSLVLAPIMALAGPGFVGTLPATVVLNVLVLGPVALLCVYWLAARIAGPLAGLWTAFLWVVLPYATIPLFVQRYHDTYVDQVLPQAVGLTQMADFPSMVALALAAVLTVRSLDRRSLEEGVLAGLVAGFALGVKPSNVLFLAGPFLAYALARRWREGLAFGLALVPAVVALALWKHRGLGELPLLALGAARVAAGPTPPVAASWLHRAVPFDWNQLARNMDYLREFFYSNRLAEWIPFAGGLGVARRSWPLAGLICGWLFAFVLVKGTSPVASIERGDFWRLTMPAFPAYVVLLGAVPLLVPGLLARLGPRADAPPARARLGLRAVAVGAVVLGVVPVAVAGLTPLSEGPGRAVLANNILVPVDHGLSLRAERRGAAVRLTWKDASPGRVFFHVFRTSGADADTACAGTGAARCELTMLELATTRARSFVDRSPPRGVTYRVGVAANYLDDPAGGDVFAVSPPLRLSG